MTKTLAALIDKFSDGPGIHATAIPGLNCIKQYEPGERLPGVYNPSVCIVTQGRKQVLLKDENYTYRPSQYLATSVDLPVIGVVTEASRDEPYLCLQVDIVPEQLAEVMLQAQLPKPAQTPARGIFVGHVDAALADCALRLTALLETPRDIPLLAPIIRQELYYRLLQSEHGATIAQLAHSDSHMHRIAGAIRRLRADYRQAFTVDEMAGWAGMSVSSFHTHFKNITAMSPLQYQKKLRLLEARRVLLADAAPAAHIAYSVGYESPSQFNREYARLFGNPPKRDIQQLRMQTAR